MNNLYLSNVQHISIFHFQIAGSFFMNSVSVYVVQLDTLKPFSKVDNSNVSYIPDQCLNPVPG